MTRLTAMPERVTERAEYTAATGRLVFKIQRVLRSPNTYLGRHWREKNRERKEWQAHLVNAIALSCSSTVLRMLVSNEILPGGLGRCTVRRRIDVTRLAPSTRRFIADDDNLRFSVKPVLDALKHIGLIKDDKREWLELPTPMQAVSEDGTFWTHIVVDDPTIVTAASEGGVMVQLRQVLEQAAGKA